MPLYIPQPNYQPLAEWLNNPRFHHPDKGCVVFYASANKCPYLTKHHKKCESCDWVGRGRCKTHKVILCKGDIRKVICGWEFRHHFGNTVNDKYYRFESKL